MSLPEIVLLASFALSMSGCFGYMAWDMYQD